MKANHIVFAIVLFLALCGSTSYAEHLVIMTTNDTHSRIDPDLDNRGGVLRRKVIFDSIRSVEKNVLAVDAGDAVQGTLYFKLYGGKVEYAMMDSLRYDISILGNHEFDNGLEAIAPYIKGMKAVRLSANYDLSRTALAGAYQPYVIKEYQGKKIAFMGINLKPTGIISDANFRGMAYKDALKTANDTAHFLKTQKKVDYVIMVSHIGYTSENPGEESDIDVVKSSHDIDLVIGGHSHTTIDPAKGNLQWKFPNADGKLVIVSQTGSSGKNVGVIDLDLDNLQAAYRLIPVNSSYDSRAIYPGISSFLKPYRAGFDSLMNRSIAVSAQKMVSYGDRAMNWVSDVTMIMAGQLTKKSVDLAIMNKGGLRQEIPQGGITEGLINSMFPFNNKIVVMDIKGSDLLDALAVMAGRNGDAVSRGVKVAYDKDKKIVKATLFGKRILKTKTYRLATLDYLANGGDYMKPLKSGKRLFIDKEIYSVRMIDYLKHLNAARKQVRSVDEKRMFQVK